MALRGCCCCGLRGGTLAIGVFFLVVTLLHLLGVITAWAIVAATRPSDVASVGVDTPEGRFGVRLRESHPLLGGQSGGDISLDLGSYGGSISSSGQVRFRTPLGNARHNYSPRPALYEETILIPNTVFVLLSLLFNSMLVHGANNASSCAVLAWLVYYGMMFVLTTLSSLGALIACPVLLTTSHPSDGGLGMLLGVSGGACLLLSALLWFWWAVVLTFQRQLSDGTAGYKYRREVMLHEAPPLITEAGVQDAEARA